MAPAVRSINGRCDEYTKWVFIKPAREKLRACGPNSWMSGISAATLDADSCRPYKRLQAMNRTQVLPLLGYEANHTMFLGTMDIRRNRAVARPVEFSGATLACVRPRRAASAT